MSKKIAISVSNDLATDQRVEKVASVLLEMGYDITLIGRKLKKSPPVNRKYRCFRFKLLFNKGPLFYAELNFRLFFKLFFLNPDVLLANDLDTLLPNYLVARLRGNKLVYDSHEYFTEVPELIDRPARKVWLGIEKRIFPKLKNVYTVGNEIAKIYSEKYGVKVKVIRNLAKKDPQQNVNVSQLKGEIILIYQGAINVNRGIELMIDSMAFLPDYQLYIFGDGDITEDIKTRIDQQPHPERINFMGRVSPNQLMGYTKQAQLGLSWEEDMGLNYRYAMPNKIFDYIMAGVPVLVSDLPEMKQLVKDYGVGEIINSRAPETLASQVRGLVEDATKYQKFQSATIEAAEELNWEKESEKLKEIYNNLL